MEKLQPAVLRTLAYADVFDYPLTAQEVFKFFICNKKLDKETVQKTLSLMTADLKLIDKDYIYYCLGGRQNIIYLREKRKRFNQEKLKIVRQVAQRLRLIPWIKMVGITGALAMNNVDEADDIDILIVCSEGRLWLTRLASVLLLEALGKRRRPNDREVRNKISLNMFLDEAHLAVPKKERDLFSAHEACQLKILWDEERIAEKFFWENRWITKYLPNTLNTANKNTKHHESISGNLCWNSCLLVLERIAKKMQLWYMAKRRTTELISDGVLRFHPQDARKWVLEEYNKKLGQLGIVS